MKMYVDAGWVVNDCIVPILAPSCKLKLARFSAKLRIQDGAECGKMVFTPPKKRAPPSGCF